MSLYPSSSPEIPRLPLVCVRLTRSSLGSPSPSRRGGAWSWTRFPLNPNGLKHKFSKKAARNPNRRSQVTKVLMETRRSPATTRILHFSVDVSCRKCGINWHFYKEEKRPEMRWKVLVSGGRRKTTKTRDCSRTHPLNRAIRSAVFPSVWPQVLACFSLAQHTCLFSYSPAGNPAKVHCFAT